jgi:hypothetical protein
MILFAAFILALTLWQFVPMKRGYPKTKYYDRETVDGYYIWTIRKDE